MGDNWSLVKLGEFIDLKTGHPFKSKLYSDTSGIKLLRGDNIVQGQFRWANVKFWPKELVTEKESEYLLSEGDVILAMDRPWIHAGLKTAQIAQSDLPCLLVQRTARLRSKAPDDQDFLRYLITSHHFVQYVKLVQTGTAVPHISPKQIKDFTFNKPPKETRLKIGEIIKSLDKKRHLNNLTNKTLEQMAQALFKSWFVDFDPVIDNALAAGNPIPGELQERAELRQRVIAERATNPKLKPLPDDIQQLFPSEFEESELGWIPKGWRVASLAELTTELRRGISPKYLEEGGIQVINQKCIRNHEINFSLCRRNNLEIKKVTGRELLLGDVLVNSTGVGTLGRMAQINNLPEPTVVDSHVTVVRPDITKCPAHTFGQIMLTNERSIEALGEGSTGQTELSRKILSEQKVILPPIAITSRIEKTFRSYAEKQISHSVQITTLAKLRDALLPKLISGKLDISSEKLNLEQAISLKD